ncbi:MAG: glycosyltransferase family protein [Deltaproteobacteria bacterium]|nr:glycosyltransferase family protein [Deltaproteobacteria bacterium]
MNKFGKKIVATIECRMTSSRLPGKVLKEACGKPMLELLVERLRRVKAIEEIILATTTNSTDDPIVSLAKRMGVNYFRGSEHDVLKRVLCAAKSFDGEILVEVTGDCPLLDPEVISQGIALYLHNDCDYVSNLDPVSFPVGIDTQVFSVDLLALADKETDVPADREHVSWFIRRQPQRFRKLHLPAPQELHWPELGLTLDEERDYKLITNIFEHFYLEFKDFSTYDILRYLRANPALLEMNKEVSRTRVQ